MLFLLAWWCLPPKGYKYDILATYQFDRQSCAMDDVAINFVRRQASTDDVNLCACLACLGRVLRVLWAYSAVYLLITTAGRGDGWWEGWGFAS